MPNISFSKQLSNFDIIDLCDNLRVPLHGVFMKDTLPSKLQNGFYVLNLDEEAGNGTHWTVMYKEGNTICYFDSFGCPPPERVSKIVKGKNKHCYYSDKIIQDLKSVVCGFYCVAFIWFFCSHDGNPVEKLEGFHDIFHDNGDTDDNIDGKKNDQIIKKLIVSNINR